MPFNPLGQFDDGRNSEPQYPIRDLEAEKLARLRYQIARVNADLQNAVAYFEKEKAKEVRT